MIPDAHNTHDIDNETKTNWICQDDPFLGRCVVIRLAPFDPTVEKSQLDYAAHLTNLSLKYEYERHFFRHRRGHSNVLVACDRLGEGAVIEVRINGTREYFRCLEGQLERITASEVRASIAMWRFSTGQPLHNELENK